jgi:hypothetical protein
MVQMVPRGTPRKAVATWEHIVNDARIITREKHRALLLRLQRK